MTQNKQELRKNWIKNLNLDERKMAPKMEEWEIQIFIQFKQNVDKLNWLDAATTSTQDRNIKDLSRFDEIWVKLIKIQNQKRKNYGAKTVQFWIQILTN